MALAFEIKEVGAVRRFFIVILCCLLLCTAVSAAGTVNDLQNTAVVSSDGTCEVTLVFTMTNDGTETLRYPLPADAYNITINGSTAKTAQEYLVRWVDLSKVASAPGTYTITLHYELPDRIVRDKKALTLTLPLLSGFACPIEHMQFSITLPGAFDGTPVFTSTYYPESTDSLMSYSVTENTISGTVTQPLKDHETLIMTLPVSAALFPQTIGKQWSLSNEDLAMFALALAALIYWIIFLRSAPPQRLRRTQPIDGLTAGELGCCLIGQGVDFTAMVLSWAQMGYLTIRIDRSRRVLLQKQMNMGNERSELEMRCFKTLFGGRRIVDGGGEYFGRLSRKMSRTVHGARHYFRKGSGNPMIFRGLSAGIGIFAGISLAAAFASDTAWRVVLSILLGCAGGAAAWLIQAGARCLHLRKKYALLIAAGCSILWFTLSRIAGEEGIAIFMILTQFLAGIASAYGGRRTEEGKQAMAEVLGLRRYLTKVTTAELRPILDRDPDYYFTLAPFAIALGVDRMFAHRFDDLQMEHCLYLSDDRHTPRTASGWNKLLREVVTVLDARQRRPLR